MKASEHLRRAESAHKRMENHLAEINRRVAKLLAPSNADAFVMFQPGDGFVVVWGDGLGNNTPVSPDELDGLLDMTYEAAVAWLEDWSI